MQNKGAIRLFAILLALVSLYQLSFTYKAKRVEKEAAQSPQGVQAYLDSVKNIPVYDFLFGLRKYTYQECKEREINFGLDLKGGMNLILEVQVSDVVRALANYNTDPTFVEALKLAEKREKTSGSNFVTLFGEAFTEIDPQAQLSAIFNTVELKGEVNYNSTNAEVLDVIRVQTQGSIDNAFNILRTRIDKFGVTQPNIQKLEKAGRVLIELPGITDPQRVRKLLQGTANLEFWETYNNEEVYSYIVQAEQKTREIETAKLKPETTETGTTDEKGAVNENKNKEDDLALLQDMESDSLKIDSLSASVTKSLFTYLLPSQNPKGPVVGISAGKDTAEVNAYLQLPVVKTLLPKDLKFLWSVKPMPTKDVRYYTSNTTNEKDSYYQLVALKISTFDGRPPLEGDAIVNANKNLNQRSQFEVNMTMNAEGAKTWAKLTKNNIGKCIAIVLDGYVYSNPTVQSEISGGRSQITGNFSATEADDLVNILKSGKLPAPARIVEDNVVGPSLGAEAVHAGLTSFIWAFIVVLVYMIFYYGFKAGMVADLALITNMFFIMGVLASFGAVLTLPGIAGIVLTIGMSVDANVLIYERIKEELRAGKGIRLALSDGYSNAFSAIIDSNVTTFLTGLILFLFGTGPIKGFATTLMIGIATSFFTAIFISRLIFEKMLTKKDANISFTTKYTKHLFEKLHIKFLEKRNIFFIISGTLILFSIGSLLTEGLKQGIDFTGGRTFVIRFDEPISSVDVQKSLVAEFDGATVEVKTFGESDQIRIATNYMIDVNNDDTDNAVEGKLYEGLKSFIGGGVTKDDFLKNYRMSSQKVGPTIATDIKTKAGYAIFFSLIVIFLYILIRFRNWEYGFGALIALMHDVIIVLGIFSLTYNFMPFSLEIDQAFIAAILTVIGYSINDTVVVFDRIREYLGLHPKKDRIEVIDSALNSTVSRTLNTSLTTFVVLLVIFLFGSEVIQGFVFALMIGVVVGTYSSLFIATPISYSLIEKKHRAKK